MAEVLMGACYSIWPTRSTPLHIAAAKGNAAVVKLLLHAQVPCHIKNMTQAWIDTEMQVRRG